MDSPKAEKETIEPMAVTGTKCKSRASLHFIRQPKLGVDAQPLEKLEDAQLAQEKKFHGMEIA